MEMSMKGSGRMTRLMGWEDTFIEMVQVMKVVGLKINNMVKALKNGLIMQDMRVSTVWV
jgi:hypothetical protein